MSGGGQIVEPSGWLQYALPLAVFAVIFAVRARRMTRERPLKLGQLWVVPAVFLAALVATFIATPPHGAGWLVVAAAFAIGAALGWQRGKTIRISVDPETQALNQKASPMAFLFLVALVVAKQAARAQGAALHLDLAMLSDALLAMAAGTFGVMRLEMYLRAKRLLAEARSGPIA